MFPFALVAAIAANHVRRADEDDARRRRVDASDREGASLRRAAAVESIGAQMDRVRDALAHARSHPKPDLDLLAGVMDIEIRRIRMLRDDICGWTRPIDIGKWRIALNAAHPETRRRFTIACMLGHNHYHRDLMRFGTGIGANANRSYEQIEDAPFHNPSIGRPEIMRASKFAIELLMPTALVKDMLDQGMDAHSIATMMCVTNRVAEIRIEGLRKGD